MLLVPKIGHEFLKGTHNAKIWKALALLTSESGLGPMGMVYVSVEVLVFTIVLVQAEQRSILNMLRYTCE